MGDCTAERGCCVAGGLAIRWTGGLATRCSGGGLAKRWDVAGGLAALWLSTGGLATLWLSTGDWNGGFGSGDVVFSRRYTPGIAPAEEDVGV